MKLKSVTGHLGFDPAILSESLRKLGFDKIHYEQCFEVQKEIVPGEQRNSPFFYWWLLNRVCSSYLQFVFVV